jgi:DNA polymerase delta subunit 4
MPATRRSTRSSQQAGGKQSTLSFNNRVTKPVPKSAKKATTPVKASPLAKQPFKDEVKSEDDDVAKVEAPEVAATSQDVIEEKEQEEAPVEDDKSAAELRATKITDRQITGYWNKLEKERKAKRVHQGDLTLAEKVLRYFDVSSQYGVSDHLEFFKFSKFGSGTLLEIGSRAYLIHSLASAFRG